MKNRKCLIGFKECACVWLLLFIFFFSFDSLIYRRDGNSKHSMKMLP